MSRNGEKRDDQEKRGGGEKEEEQRQKVEEEKQEEAAVVARRPDRWIQFFFTTDSGARASREILTGSLARYAGNDVLRGFLSPEDPRSGRSRPFIMDPCSDAARCASARPSARANRQFLFVRIVLHPAEGCGEGERYDDG